MSGPVYTYTLCTPDSASPMNQTQPLIQENFQAMNELMNVDHIGFNIPSTFGQHQKLTLPMQSSIPDAVDTDIIMFSQLTPSGPNLAEIFGVWPTGSVYQITGVVVPSTNPTSGTGWSLFPSGVIFRWGQVTVSSSVSPYVFTLPVGAGIPVFKTAIAYVGVLPINVTPVQQNSTLTMPNIVASATLTTISVTYLVSSYASPFQFSYFLIGI